MSKSKFSKVFNKILLEANIDKLAKQDSREIYGDEQSIDTWHKAQMDKEDKQGSMSHMLVTANELYDIGSRLLSVYKELKDNKHVSSDIKDILTKDGEYLIDASTEIEDIYNKYLSV